MSSLGFLQPIKCLHDYMLVCSRKRVATLVFFHMINVFLRFMWGQSWCYFRTQDQIEGVTSLKDVPLLECRSVADPELACFKGKVPSQMWKSHQDRKSVV